MNEWLVALSYAIHWPTVGWVGIVAVLLLAVVWVAYEVTGEIRRKRRIARRRERDQGR